MTFRDEDLLLRERAAGKSYRELAARFNITTKTVQRVLMKHGLTTPRPEASYRVDDAWKAEVERLLDEETPYIEVARTMGCNTQTLRRHFPGRGWKPEQIGRHGNAVRKANRDLRKQGQTAIKTGRS